MSRLSFRPRPLDIHKKLPIVKSVREFEDEETTTSTRNSQILRFAVEDDNEVHQIPSKKSALEIPTPQFAVVDSYERDYSCTFDQSTSYLRGRGARAEIGEFVEYDLDNEDEDWLEEFNNERKILTPEEFESLLFKLEVLDHKTRERAGVITPTLGSPVPVILQQDAALEALQSSSKRHTVFQSVYNYWKVKREQWQKPILRRLQPPPPTNDTNPYNVFRPREKAHRLHTRRMQRRENNVQSFDKLRQVRRNLDQAKAVIEALIKREEKKREAMESEVSLQRIQMKYKHETQLVEDGMVLGFPPFPCKFGSGEDDFATTDDLSSGPHTLSAAMKSPFTDSRLMMVATGHMKRELRRRPLPQGWIHKRDPHEPVWLFMRPLDPEKLAATGIIPPSDPPIKNGTSAPLYRFHGRIGRGGRIVFDRWNPLSRTPIDHDKASYAPPNSRPLSHS